MRVCIERDMVTHLCKNIHSHSTGTLEALQGRMKKWETEIRIPKSAAAFIS